MTDCEVFDLYAAKGMTPADFEQYVGQPVMWLALEIADMDPDCPDPLEAARQFMRYVADCLAGDTDDAHESSRGKIVCRSSHGAYTRHFYTDRSTGLSVPTDVCVRCGEPRPKSTWTLNGKVRCPGSNTPGDYDIDYPTTTQCDYCERRITVRYSRPRNAWIMRTHYVKEWE